MSGQRAMVGFEIPELLGVSGEGGGGLSLKVITYQPPEEIPGQSSFSRDPRILQ